MIRAVEEENAVFAAYSNIKDKLKQAISERDALARKYRVMRDAHTKMKAQVEAKKEEEGNLTSERERLVKA